MRIQPTSYDHPDAVKLQDEVQAEYVVRYGDGEGDATPLDPGMFVPPRGLYLLAYDDGDRPVASGAWRFRPELAEELGMVRPAEVKRMYVVPDAQRSGHARTMLRHLEVTAAERGATHMILETGAPQIAAIALYTSSGYEPVPSFGHYRWSPTNRCFARTL